MNAICLVDSGRRYATRFAFGVVKPALKRGPTLDCRYRGKIKPVIEKALSWKRGSTLDCRYGGKVKLVIGRAALRCPLAASLARCSPHWDAPRSLLAIRFCVYARAIPVFQQSPKR